MNLYGVACVKNEEDIIEAFVRHNLAYLARLILLDHGSSDGTSAILRQLQNEGLELEVIRDESLGRLQGEKMTMLMRRAAESGADWIFLLDADELLKPSNDGPLCFPGTASPVIKIPWTTYCTRSSDMPSELNPALRICHHLVSEPYQEKGFNDKKGHFKAVVRKDLALNPETFVLQGSHQVMLGGVEADFIRFEDWTLAHYSLRSPGQYSSKIAIGVLQHLSNGSMSAPIDSFYVKHLEEICRDFDVFSSGFHEHIPSYLEIIKHSPEKVYDPLRYKGGPLLYTVRISEPVRLTSNLLSYAETLARTLGQHPPESQASGKVACSISLKTSGQLSPSQPLELSAVNAGLVAVSLESMAPGEIPQLELGGPAGYIECVAATLRAKDGSTHKISGPDLRKLLYVCKKGQQIYHERYYTFAKGTAPSLIDLTLPPPGISGPWHELELFIRFDTSPTVMGLRYFQEDPFDRPNHPLNKIRQMEKRINEVVRLRGFLAYQWGVLKKILLNKLSLKRRE